MQPKKMKSLHITILSLFTLFLFTACSNTIGGEDSAVRLHKDEFTEEDQRIIGNSINNYLSNRSSDLNVLPKDEYAFFYQYLDHVLQPLINTSAISTRNSFDWEVIVIQDDDVRSAFHVPGGKIYIYTGLLKFLQAENQLLGVIAHEVSYIESGEIMNELVQEYVKDPYFLGDILLGREVEGMDGLMHFLKDFSYTKEEVLEADKFAISLICPFNYNAIGLKTILELAEQSDSEIQWCINRPSADNRMERIIAAAKECGSEEDPVFAERYFKYISQLP